MMYMGYEIKKCLDRYECRQDGIYASALTPDGVKKFIDRHIWDKAYAAWQKTGEREYMDRAYEAWIAAH